VLYCGDVLLLNLFNVQRSTFNHGVAYEYLSYSSLPSMPVLFTLKRSRLKLEETGHRSSAAHDTSSLLADTGHENNTGFRSINVTSVHKQGYDTYSSVVSYAISANRIQTLTYAFHTGPWPIPREQYSTISSVIRGTIK
jgi:hypothetical protein